MKILLVDPPVSPFAWNQTPAPPLGLLYLAAAIRHRMFGLEGFHEVRVLPLQLYKDNAPEQLSSTILDYRPDLIGFSTPTPSTPAVLSLVALARQVSPSTLIVLGGYQATIDSEALLCQRAADIVVRGEGEKPFCQILSAVAKKEWNRLKSIKGTAFRTPEGRVSVNPPARRINNLDVLPFPERSLVPMEYYRQLSEHRAGAIIGSRGCPWICRFCYSPQLWGAATYRSAKNIADEVEKELIDRYGLGFVRFEDDTFIVSRHRVLKFCDEIRRRRLEFKWEARTRMDLVDEEMLFRMRDAGLVSLQVGVETIHDATLHAMNRGLDFSLYEGFFRLIRKAGLQVRVTVIIGIPGETPKQMLETLSWVESHLTENDKFIRCLFTPFPGLVLNDQNWRILSADLSNYTMDIPLVTSDLLSYEDLLEVKAVADQLMYKYGPDESTRHPLPNITRTTHNNREV